MRKSNLMTGVVFLALSVFAYVQSLGMVGRIATDELGPGFWPQCLSVAMGLLSIALIGKSCLEKKLSGGKPVFDIKSPGFWRVTKLGGVMVLFGALIYLAGIYVGMLVMLPLGMLLHGERNMKIILSLTAGIMMFVFLVFGLGLRVPLPMGHLFS